MADHCLLAIAVLALGLSCASAGPPRCELATAPVSGRFAQVDVALAGDAASLDAKTAARVSGLVRQSARDWLEQRDRAAPEGELALEVSIEAVRVRGSLSAWLFAWALAPAALAAQVSVRRGAERVPRCPVRVESALSGYSWRDPDPRLDRLARRLGRRVAEGL